MLYWHNRGTERVLHQCCAGTILAQYWHCTGTVLHCGTRCHSEGFCYLRVFFRRCSVEFGQLWSGFDHLWEASANSGLTSTRVWPGSTRCRLCSTQFRLSSTLCWLSSTFIVLGPTESGSDSAKSRRCQPNLCRFDQACAGCEKTMARFYRIWAVSCTTWSVDEIFRPPDRLSD